jgi:hypothetical protein
MSEHSKRSQARGAFWASVVVVILAAVACGILDAIEAAVQMGVTAPRYCQPGLGPDFRCDLGAELLLTDEIVGGAALLFIVLVWVIAMTRKDR